MAITTIIKDQKVNIGDTIRVYQKFKVDDKTQSQIFEGLLIAIKGRGVNKSFTARKIAADSIGVEKIWPVNSPNITKVTVKKKGNTRRAKLYYLRNRLGKESLKVKGRK